MNVLKRLWNQLWALYLRYKEIVTYVFFGCCTTAVNYMVYFVSYYALHIPNVPSDALAWIISVAFAFVTNKLFVFESKSRQIKLVLFELLSFVGCRAATGLTDVGLMYLLVDVSKGHPVVMKVAVSVITAILNYIFSKLFIFSKRIRGRLSEEREQPQNQSKA